MNLMTIARNYFHRVRKIKTYIPKHYQAIPQFYKPIFIDIHDTYTLRSKQQLKKQLEQKEFKYNITEIQVYDAVNFANKSRKAVLQFDYHQFKFTRFQLQRYKVIMGPRYKSDTNLHKLTCEMYGSFQQNFQRLKLMFYQIIVQSKRAP